MAKISEAVKRCMMTISFQERRNRDLMRYLHKKKRLGKMKTDELDLEYIHLKSAYEHKKNVLSTYKVSIIVMILMGTWKCFNAFVEKILQYSFKNPSNTADAAKVIAVISAIAVVSITVIIFTVLIVHTRNMYQIYRDLVIVEEIRN